MKKSWKETEEVPRVVAAAVRKGLRIADSIGVEEADDKTWLTITFRKLKSSELAQAGPQPQEREK